MQYKNDCCSNLFSFRQNNQIGKINKFAKIRNSWFEISSKNEVNSTISWCVVVNNGGRVDDLKRNNFRIDWLINWNYLSIVSFIKFITFFFVLVVFFFLKKAPLFGGLVVLVSFIFLMITLFFFERSGSFYVIDIPAYVENDLVGL